jgi:hypothetical protein
MTIDHVFPRAHMGREYVRKVMRGGLWGLLNKLYACDACNQAKAHLMPLQWMRKMPEPGVRDFARRLLRLNVEIEEIAQAILDRPDNKREPGEVRQWLHVTAHEIEKRPVPYAIAGVVNVWEDYA